MWLQYAFIPIALGYMVHRFRVNTSTANDAISMNTRTEFSAKNHALYTPQELITPTTTKEREIRSDLAAE